MREKTVKLGEQQYQTLTAMLKGTRQRAQVIEGLIAILSEAIKEDRYILYDVLNDPSALTIKKK